MAERLYTIKQAARSVHIAAANVSDSFTPPTLEEDMEAISIAIWGGVPVDQITAEQELSCET